MPQEAPLPKLNPEWVSLLSNSVSDSPYFALQTMLIKDLTYGASHIEIPIQKKHLQPFAMVHGGVFASLIDAAGFWAVYTQIEEGMGLTTVELKLNYLAPALLETKTLVGKGESLKLGRTLGLASASIFDLEDKLLAHGTTTVMVLPGLHVEGESSLPPKFMK